MVSGFRRAMPSLPARRSPRRARGRADRPGPDGGANRNPRRGAASPAGTAGSAHAAARLRERFPGDCARGARAFSFRCASHADTAMGSATLARSVQPTMGTKRCQFVAGRVGRLPSRRDGFRGANAREPSATIRSSTRRSRAPLQPGRGGPHARGGEGGVLRAQLRAACRTKLSRRLEIIRWRRSRLRVRPAFRGGLEPLLASPGQVQLLAAAVGRSRLDPDQPVALQRQDVAPERRAIHDHLRRELIDGHRRLPSQLREDGELGRAQAARRQEPVVELRHVPSSLAHGEAIACPGTIGHRRAFGMFLLDKGVYALISANVKSSPPRARAIFRRAREVAERAPSPGIAPSALDMRADPPRLGAYTLNARKPDAADAAQVRVIVVQSRSDPGAQPMTSSRTVVLAAPVRTAIGTFGGSLKYMPAADLGAVAIAAAVERAGLERGEIGTVVMGNVIQAGSKMNPGRQAAIHAGLPVSVPAMTVNRVCGSGAQAILSAAHEITSGALDVAVGGGMENMDQAPYVIARGRWGYRMGDGQLYDSMLRDGLNDAFSDRHSGWHTEDLAEKFQVTREAQDQWALRSQQRFASAQASGKFKDEIVPVEVAGRKGPVSFNTDEHSRPDTTLDKLAALKPAFRT